MSDPRYDNRTPIIDGTPSNTGWFIAAAAAVVLVFGVLFYSMNGDAPQTAAARKLRRPDRLSAPPPLRPIPAERRRSAKPRNPDRRRLRGRGSVSDRVIRA